MKNFLSKHMKLILITVFILLFTVAFSAISHAQDSVTIKIPDTTKLTAKQVYSDIKEGLTGMAQALKTPVEQVYKVIVIQQYVKAMINTAAYILVFILLFFAYKQGMKETDWDSISFKGVSCIVIAIIAVIIWLVACNFNQIVTGFVNPHYGAIKDISEFIKTIRQ